MENSKQIPVVDKIIAVLYYLTGIFGFIGGILFLAIGKVETSIFSMFGYVGGTIMVVLGILFIYVGSGLYQNKKWAKIFAIVVACLMIVSSITDMISGNFKENIISLFFNITIAGYLFVSIKK